MQVLPGSELGQPSSQMDLMPTLVEVGRGKLPKDLLLDGVSMAGGGGGEQAGGLHGFRHWEGVATNGIFKEVLRISQVICRARERADCMSSFSSTVG